MDELTPVVGVATACKALGVARSTWYRWARELRHRLEGDAPSRARSLDVAERQRLVEVLHTPRFRGANPRAVCAALLDEGVYLGSPSTMYRVLRETDLPRQRTAPRPAPVSGESQRPGEQFNQWVFPVATGRGASHALVRVLVDDFSRFPVRWELTDPASTIAERCLRQGTGPEPGRLETVDESRTHLAESWGALLNLMGVRTDTIVHPDPPTPVEKLRDLDVDLARPPRFTSATDVQAQMERFWSWFAFDYRHPDLHYYTPHQIYSGKWVMVYHARASVLEQAYASHPERFVNQPPEPQPPPGLDPPPPSG